MRPVLTAAEMRSADRRTIEDIGIPGVILMENAGAAVAREIRDRFPGARRIVVLCGKGNNGGDGFVIARRLTDLDPRVFLLGARDEVKGDAAVHLAALERTGVRAALVRDADEWAQVRPEVLAADLVVDALLGTGLRDAPHGLLGVAIADLGGSCDPRRVVSVDLPSGLRSDSGRTEWASVIAGLTVTFGAPKHGHVLSPSCERVGALSVADIGIPEALLQPNDPGLWLLEAEDAGLAFPRRPSGTHKGTYGHVLILAGSVGKTGAATLAATAALRTGAGLVTVATAEPAAALVAAGGRPEVMTERLRAAADGGLAPEAVEQALALAATRDAVVLGPGLGTEEGSREFVRQVVARCSLPLVIDAEGLNALASVPDSAGRLRRTAPTVITPHPGEMARLIEAGTPQVQEERLATARAFSTASGAVVVLKGSRTVVADPSGRAAVNPTGNPGMATAGTGDVLAGILGALLARGLSPWVAATAGVFTHGLAGDCAARRLGEESLLAGDVIEALAEAIRGVRSALGDDPERDGDEGGGSSSRG